MTDVRDTIASGALAAMGLIDAHRIDRATAVLEQARAQRLETVRVVFADQNGILRGKTIVASALGSVLANGLAAPSTLLLKDTSHRTAFPVWQSEGEVAGGLRGASDILMVPDPATFRPLPWSPRSAWLLCDLAYPDGTLLPLCTRSILRRAVAALSEKGMALTVGLEVEFHVFAITDPRLDHAAATMPGQPVETRNIAQGYQFLTEQRYDEMEAVIDLLRRNAQALGLPLRSMEVEMGPSQLEFTFDPASAAAHADNMVFFRAMVKEVCQRNGLHATFMCKPGVPNAAASGWHLHQSLCDLQTDENLFAPPQSGGMSDICSYWIAGLLEHAAESCLLTTPTVNGYKRYQPHQLAPDRIVWGRDNRGAMIRALVDGPASACRIENRVAEPAANPYLYFASQIYAGLRGLETGVPAPQAVEDPYDPKATGLPETLLAAIDAFAGSDLFKARLGEEFVTYLTRIRRAEWQRYHAAISAWEQQEYFNLF